MQKVLLLANRLPQLKSMADFREVGGERLAQALTQSKHQSFYCWLDHVMVTECVCDGD